MKQIVIFGAGQAGRALYRMMHHTNQRVVAFADNNPAVVGQTIDGIPIVSLMKAAELRPDGIQIAIVNPDACEEVEQRLRAAGYQGEIARMSVLREQINIRLATVRLMAEEVRRRNVPGALAELGVYQGEFAAELNRLFPDPSFYLFDTFSGFDERDVSVEQHSQAKAGDFQDTSVELVLDRLPHPEMAIVRQGYFPATAQGLEDQRYAMVSLDADLYLPMYEGLQYFYPRMSPGGYIILHDYNSRQYRGAGEAVQKYCEEHHVFLFPLCDLHGTGVLVKPQVG